ncbi:MAG: Hpt domain-containing protein [Bacteroidia bacterium]|nr:MAG: Hpt domain-containing protein [Bacteroidia bacterium]
MIRVNVSYIEEVCGKDKEIIAEMVKIFCDQVPEIIQELKENYSSGNYYELGLVAHKAKSSVAIMGMTDLSGKLKELELKAKAGEEKHLYKGYIDDYLLQTAEAISELNEYLKAL